MKKLPAMRRILKAELEVPEVQPLGTLGSAMVFSRGGPAHPENQDAALMAPVGPEAAVLVVADGMGGARGGAAAARAVVREVAKVCDEARTWWGDATPLEARASRLRAALIESLERANTRVIRARAGGGTTALIALVVDDRMQLLNVGDSQGVLVGQRGKVKYMTTAQSPIGYAVEAGVLEYDDALLHPARHVLSNAVGTKGMSIELGPWLRVARRDTLLMGSDGLFDNLFGMELVDLSRKGSLQQAATRLQQLAAERMRGAQSPQQPCKPDDLTFLLFRRGSAPRPRAAEASKAAS